MKPFHRCIARLLIVCTLGLGLPLPAAADIVATDEIVAGVERDRLRSFLDRADVRAQLQSLGVDPQSAGARVDALTEAEARDLAARIGELPAGGDALGILFAVFIVLLVADILGFTKVFPFTRSVR